jgi:hypothetical protein
MSHFTLLTIPVFRRALLLLVGLLASWVLPIAARAQAPANDDPCGAVVLSPQGPLCTAPTVSTNLNATTTTPNGYGNTGNPQDVWFKFTTTATGAGSFGATITVNGNPASFVQLFSAPSCSGPFAPIAFSSSNQANTTAPRLITGSLQASTTYYVRVSGNTSFGDAPGPFTICVSDGPGVPACGSPVVGQFTATSSTSGTIAFTPGLNNSTTGPFLVTVRNTTTQTQVGTPFTVTSSPITLTGLVAGNSYSVTVATSCPTGGQASGSNSFNLPVNNDDPCGAVALPVGSTCSYIVGNNANATASNGNFGSNTGTCSNRGSHDVWFTFTTAAAGQTGSTGVTVSTNGQSSAAGTLRVYAAATCAGPFTPLGCSTSTLVTSPGAAGPLVVSNLVPNTTYYVRVDEGGFFNTGFPGTFSICVVGAVGCAAPTQLYSGVVGATTAPLFWTAGNGNQSYTITYTAQGGTPQTVTAPAGNTYTLTNLTPGTRYTVSLVGNCAGGNTSTAATTSFTTAIVNDEPCGAVAVPLGGAACATPTSVSFFGATTTAPSPLGYANPGCYNSASPNDVWFTFTTAASGAAATGATLSASSSDIYEMRVFSGPGCTGPFTQIGCVAQPGSNSTVPPLTLTGLTPATTYFVKLTGNSNASNPASLCIVDPAPCPGPTGLTVGTLTSNSATLSFTAGAGSTSYVVTYQAAGGAVQTVSPAPVASPVVLSGLNPSTSYTATVRAVCSAGLGAPLVVTFTTPAVAPGAPANDDCAGATPLTSIGVNTCGTLLTGTVTGATSSTGAPAPGCASYQGGDVWYSLVVPANGVLQVETGASGSGLSDTGLALYSGSCGSLTLLGCNDDIGGGNNFSRLRQTGLTPGSTVYARVWRYGNATLGGDFTICAQTDAACPAVTGLVVGNITGSAATLTFSGPANATGYTVTYQAANGAVQTQTATASPVILSGLSSSTVYTATVTTNCGAGQTSTAATVTFTTTAPCPAVTNVAVSNLTGTSATLSFTAPAAVSGGFTITLTPSGGTSQTITAATSPVQLTGLTPLTGYTVSIVGSCGGGLSSTATTASFFSTAYCITALGGACGGQNLTNVSIATTPLNNTSTCATTGTGSSTAAYSSYPAAGTTTADLVRGRTYSISLTSDGSSDLSLWVDFNRNGQFEASEHTQVVLNGIANLPATATFTVPATAQLGLTGLRVRSRVSGAGNGPGDACSTFASGETEDYFVTLTDPVVNSAQSALAAQIDLYPNPARRLATLHLPAALAQRAATAVLYNALGQPVRKVALPATNTGGSTTALDLMGLPSGVYALRINTVAGLLTKRLVVE